MRVCCRCQLAPPPPPPPPHLHPRKGPGAWVEGWREWQAGGNGRPEGIRWRPQWFRVSDPIPNPGFLQRSPRDSGPGSRSCPVPGGGMLVGGAGADQKPALSQGRFPTRFKSNSTGHAVAWPTEQLCGCTRWSGGYCSGARVVLEGDGTRQLGSPLSCGLESNQEAIPK